MRARNLGTLALVLLLGLTVQAETGSPNQGQTGELRVRVDGLRNDSGNVIFYLYASEQSFLKPGVMLRKTIVPLSAKTACCEFLDLPEGNYAVSIAHDENGNGHFDLDLLGRPAEGFCVPAAGILTERPDWNRARVHVTTGTVELAGSMQYVHP
jgi:uncharacterized protein (DUF2141 family)